MKKLKLFSVNILVMALLFGLTPVHAQDIEVFPTTLDFGDVEVSYYSTGILTMVNFGATEYSIDVGINGTTDFTIESNIPASIAPGAVIDILIKFEPTVEGLAIGTIEIEYIDGSSGTETVELSGVGVAPQQPPVSIQDILDYFDESVADGTLVGDGPGDSAGKRLNALRNMLIKADYLICEGDFEAACKQLFDIYLHCDSQTNPLDFVSGTATTELNCMVLDLMISLGCI